MRLRSQRKKRKKYLYIFVSVLIAAFILISVKMLAANHIDLTQKAAIEKPHSSIEKPSFQTPEQFGANGFDNKPDTVAIQKAIDSGNSIILKSGATYIIDEPLVSRHSIEIKTNDLKGAVILQKNKTSALVIDNKPITNTHVTQHISSKQPYVVLATTKGIKPGNLIHLKSSKLWYWDDRGYLTKGELHEVTKVDGNKVFLDTPIVENYLVGKGELVSATVYPNISLRLDNITFSHPKPYKTVMLKVNYTINSKLERVSVKNSKETGISLNNTFQTEVHEATIDLGTTKDINTGYGIQDYGGSGTLIANSIFKRVRRGVDFSGSTPSRYGLVKDCRAYGYIKGTLASGNSGFGTHSTAQYITFQNNYVENFNYAFLVRGSNITIKENTLQGFSSSFIAISYGDHVEVMNNTYKNMDDSSLESFILVPKTYKGSIVAQGNTTTDFLKGSFIKGDVGQLKSLILKNNTIQSK